MSNVEEPGDHGAVVTGVQGMGVRTPCAADVADATDGFDIEVHIAKGMMFVIGILSIMLAIGVAVWTIFVGRTVMVPGAVPKLHLSIAPLHTIDPVCLTSFGIFFQNRVDLNLFR